MEARPRGVFGIASVVAVLLAGALGSVAASIDTRQRTVESDRRAVDVAAAAISDSAARSLTALRGVAGLAADGEVSAAEFAAFGADVLAGTPLPSLAREVVVGDADRAQFETRTGIRVVDRDATGAFGPAARRSAYLPVVQVVPDGDATRAVLGFDVAGEPVRAAAAQRALAQRAPVFSSAVRVAPSGRPGFFVIGPVFARDDGGAPRLVGYVSAGLPLDDLLGTARERLPAGVRLHLGDGSALTGSAPGGGASRLLSVGGQSWTVTADDPVQASRVLSRVIGSSTLLVCGLLLVLWWRERRYELSRTGLTERLRAEAARAERLADLASRLSAAGQLDDVVAMLVADVPAVVGADQAEVGLLLDPQELRVAGPAPGGERALRYRGVPLDAHLPSTEAVRELRTVVVADLAAYQREHPDLLAEVRTAGLRSAAATPLLDADGEAIGVLGMAWRGATNLDAGIGPVIRTIGEIGGLTLRRTRLAQRSAEIAELAAHLATATTPADVATQVAAQARRTTGAGHVDLLVADPVDGTLTSVLPASAGAPPPADTAAAAADAVRDNRAVWLPDPDGDRAHPPAAAQSAPAGTVQVAAVPLHATDGTVSGVITLRWPAPVRADPSLRTMVATMADLTGQTLERAQLAHREAAAAERSQQVAELGQVVAGARDVDRVVAVLANRAGQIVGASSTNVALLNGARLRVVHDDRLPGALADRYAVQPLDLRLPHVDAVHTATPVLLANREDYQRSYPHVLADIVAAGLHAAACLPLLDADRRAFGALGFAWSAPRRFGPGDIATLTTIAELAARALQITEAESIQQRRAQTLSRLAQRLAACVSSDEVARTVAEVVPALTGSSCAVLAMPDQEGQLPDRSDRRGGPAGGRPGRPATGAGTPIGDALATGTPVLIGDAAACLHRYPGIRDELVRTGTEAVAALPLRDAHDRTIAVLALGWSAPTVFDAAVRALLDTTAELVGQTLERAGLYDGEHAVITDLQRRLLAPPPAVAGLELAARYQPATGALGIGGDWYQFLTRPDGSLVVVVGDVTGHGVPAIATMTQIQYLISAAIQAGTPLGRVLPEVNAMLAGAGGPHATAQLIHVDPQRQRIGHVSAGHPYPILRRPDGTTTMLTGSRQSLLGLRPSREPASLAYVDFPAGSMLLSYTDGLIERRTRTIDAGFDRLTRDVADVTVGPVLGQVLADVMAAVRRSEPGSEPLDDDVAAVLIRSTGGPAPTGATAGDPAAVPHRATGR